MKCSALCVLILFPACAQSQDAIGSASRDLTVRELSFLLSQSISTFEFQQRRPLKDAIAILQQAFRQKGVELPIHLDNAAFKEENPDAPDVYETEVKLPQFPRSLPAGRLFGVLLSQLPTNIGSYRIVPGVVRITTQEQTAIPTLLSSPIDVRFRQRPLCLCMEDLYDQTGVAVYLDPRVGARARMLVNMNFTNEISLGTVRMLMSEVCGLKLLVSEEVVIITTPAIARQFIRERMQNPYLLPDWSIPGRTRRLEPA
ncbi:MAG: hypothetical protein HY040_11850 [Planctomycetes bacterium]|nr:hypothetical protein [Planctomycetota bacterium]